MSNNMVAVIVLFFSAIGWGFTWFPIKAFNEMGLNSLHLVFIAFSAASIVLLPVLYRQRAHVKAQLRVVLLIATFGGFANLAFQVALYHGDVVRVMILFYLLPIWSVIGGRIFLKESIGYLRVIAVIMSLVGAYLILGGTLALWDTITWIDLLAIGSGMSLAACNLVFRATQEMPLGSKLSVTFLGCVIMTGAYLAYSGEQAVLPGSDVVLYAVAYGIGYLLLITVGSQWAVTLLEAGRASVIMVTEVVTAVVTTALITGHTMAAMEWIGGALVLSAALVEASRESALSKLQKQTA